MCTASREWLRAQQACGWPTTVLVSWIPRHSVGHSICSDSWSVIAFYWLLQAQRLAILGRSDQLRSDADHDVWYGVFGRYNEAQRLPARVRLAQLVACACRWLIAVHLIRIPGSHRRNGRVWDVIKKNNHLSNTKPTGTTATPIADEMFSAPGVDVPMRAGSLLLGDSRLLHATHPNDSVGRRTCITLWYLSRFESLPERVRVGFANEWAGRLGVAMLPGVDNAGLLEREDMIPRCDTAIGRKFPARSNAQSGGESLYPTMGAQDFLGSNLPGSFWVEREEQARL